MFLLLGDDLFLLLGDTVSSAGWCSFCWVMLFLLLGDTIPSAGCYCSFSWVILFFQLAVTVPSTGWYCSFSWVLLFLLLGVTVPSAGCYCSFCWVLLLLLLPPCILCGRNSKTNDTPKKKNIEMDKKWNQRYFSFSTVWVKSNNYRTSLFSRDEHWTVLDTFMGVTKSNDAFQFFNFFFMVVTEL